jgi:hypothetical protein
MTATEWLIEELNNKDWYYLSESIKNKIIEQAKEMEKTEKHAEYMRGWLNGYTKNAFK